jgi:hypothetical protein
MISLHHEARKKWPQVIQNVNRGSKKRELSEFSFLFALEFVAAIHTTVFEIIRVLFARLDGIVIGWDVCRRGVGCRRGCARECAEC